MYFVKALLSLSLVFGSTDQKIITAEFGQDVTLTCRAQDNNIVLVEWSRVDLGDEYVFMYRTGNPVSGHQQPSFVNRVDLLDRQMKDGDVSLILKDVTINDTGTYECHVQREGDSMKLINSTYLHVVPPARPRGARDDGDGVRRFDGLVAFGLLLLVCAVAAAVMISKKLKKDPPPSSSS